MNNKKITMMMLSILIAIIFIAIPKGVNAAAPATPVYFGVSTIRENSSTNIYNNPDRHSGKNIGYAISNPKANGSAGTKRVGANIWNIMTYPSSDITTTGTEGNYYCIREGYGFTDGNVESTAIRQYNDSFEMKLDNQTVITSKATCLNGISEKNYKSLIVLSNLVFLGGTEAEKIAFLTSAGINTDLEDPYNNYSVLLTESDIKAVQQAVMWYYSNQHGQTIADQWSTLYDNTSKDNWLNYTVDGKTYSSMSDYDFGRTPFGGSSGSGLDRNAQANILYRYLINTTNSIVDSGVTIENNAKIVLYTNVASAGDTQPIIYIEKAPDVREFDLALRKYITKLNGTELTALGLSTRVPNIDESTIKTGKTATYKHRKDPITVKKGDKVTYNLTIYNEGEKAGRATKIVDQLPEGLKFVKINTTGFSANYDEILNMITITRDTSNTTNLDAYKEGNLKSETIEIECEVTATANEKSEQILTNVAWISEEYDAVSNVTILNTRGQDRDSEPATNPSVNKSNMTNYTGNDNQENLADSTYYYKGQQDDDDFEKLKLPKENSGLYNIVLIKEDADGKKLDSTATFKVDDIEKIVTGELTIVENKKITSENVAIDDIYTIQETKAPDDYCKFDGIITITVKKTFEDGKYKVASVNYKVTYPSGDSILDAAKKPVTVYVNEDGNIYVKVRNYQFDLKLVKRIVEVNGDKVPERIEDVDITRLADGTETTAEYTLNKEPVSVKKGDIVKYTFRVYNEGDIDGYASQISEDIPDGLEFMWSEKTDSELTADTTLSEEEKEAIRYNQAIWDIENIDETTQKVKLISTDYLARNKGAELSTTGANLITAFDSSKEYKNTISDKNPDYKEVSVYLKVTSESSTKTIIRNEAAITEDTDKNGNPVDDRDSDPKDWKEHPDHEDDEDHDYVILQEFDLALRKFVIAVSKDANIEESEYLRNSDGTYTRAPKVDTSKLNTIGEDGKLITTAIYEHTKEPVEVEKNDIVIYMIRVYNEADIDGYASEIADHLPPYLEYVEGSFNDTYGWKASEDGRIVKTSYLDNQLISKTSTNTDGEIVLSYKEVPIMCKVTSEAKGKITNIADITLYKDEKKKVINDRDSEPNNVILPSDDKLPSYKDEETGKYIPGQQDDDDFEKLVVKEFDLALRKFITGVNADNVASRIPEVKYDKENNKITYEHTKEPVDVVTNDTVIYTIRVYNEGEIDGYASKITDDIPDGLEYLPENDINKLYRWVMYDKDGKETTDVKNAVKITTDYLSKEQGEARMKEDETIKENPALLTAFDTNKEISDTNPDYADVKVAFKVIEPNGSDRILVNSAQISEDTDKNGNPIDDIDSIPDEWNEGEDDQDKEYIKLNYFDLALRKWVTHAIVIENGKETVTQTGHKPEDDPEQVVKVELNRKKLTSLKVKFKYSIRVTNEGDIAGYAKEVTDYIPQGLKFDATDNPDWVDEGNNVISTRKLENILLQPGEYADVEVTLTWINGKDNMGLKTNIAEISEDYNEKNVPDRDSTPDNKVPGEDDIDDAPVLLSISTGQARIYYVLGFAVLITLASGIVIIKKFIL